MRRRPATESEKCGPLLARAPQGAKETSVLVPNRFHHHRVGLSLLGFRRPSTMAAIGFCLGFFFLYQAAVGYQ